jgi:hypothetical protein
MFVTSIKVQKAEKRVDADTMLRMEDLFLKYLVLQSKRTHKFGSPKNNTIGILCFLKTEWALRRYQVTVYDIII